MRSVVVTSNVGDERQLEAGEARRKLSARSTGWASCGRLQDGAQDATEEEPCDACCKQKANELECGQHAVAEAARKKQVRHMSNEVEEQPQRGEDRG